MMEVLVFLVVWIAGSVLFVRGFRKWVETEEYIDLPFPLFVYLAFMLIAVFPAWLVSWLI